ncbi:MAG: PilT/PilU family type 4a pilus ATPase [Candidatus Omnitrophota bacterium]
MVEKRAKRRQLAKLTIRYKISGQETATTETVTTVDISSKGVSFESPKLIPLGTAIETEILLPHLSEPVRAKGSIKRIDEVKKGNLYFHVMVFEAIHEKDITALEQYTQALDINHILRAAIQKNASDIHLVADHVPVLRIEGQLTNLDISPIAADDLRSMILSIMTEKQKSEFENTLELDFSYSIPEGKRFRGNIHLDKGNLEAAFRAIPPEIRSIKDLGLPLVLEDLSRRRGGLIIIAGPSGSGKTTTLAAMIDLISKERRCVIVSIEDPIEYIHQSNKSVIKQREVGVDTLSFASALKHVLRQDPNVILVGEMRDLDSISMVITAAETGHLILSTLSTPDAVECINRIIDVYPEEQQTQVRTQLAGCLEGIIVQALIPRVGREARVAATEVLVANSAIKNLIRTAQLSQIHGYMQAGSQSGMHTMDDSILELLQKGLISKESAVAFAKNPQKFRDF